MNYTLIEKLACPFDKADLTLKIYAKKEDGSITEGLLTCTVCRRYYPIIHGVPVMTPDEYREAALEQPLLDRWGIPLRENNKASDFTLLPAPVDEKPG